MDTKDIGLFGLSLAFLMFFYIMFNNDIFINSVLTKFNGLTEPSAINGFVPTNLGNVVIMTFVIICYTIAYLLIINLL